MLEDPVLRNLLVKIDTKLTIDNTGLEKLRNANLCNYARYFLCYRQTQTVHAAVLDFTKPFDLLMKKLPEIAELDKYLLRWIEDFLANRTRCMVLQGHASESTYFLRRATRTSTLSHFYQ